MKITASALLTLAAMGGMFSAQSARATLLTNGGLEASSASLTYPDGLIHASSQINPTALPGWTLSGAAIDIVPAAYWQNTQGAYSVDLVGSSGIGSISQTVSGLTQGSNYTLTFDFAVNPQTMSGEAASTKILQVSATNTTLSPTLYTGTAGTTTITNMGYTHEVLNFTANSTSTTLTMAALMPTGLPAGFLPNTVWCGPVIDNVDLEAASVGVNPTPPSGPVGNDPVPEPATPLLLAMGVAGLVLRKTRLAH